MLFIFKNSTQISSSVKIDILKRKYPGGNPIPSSSVVRYTPSLFPRPLIKDLLFRAPIRSIHPVWPVQRLNIPKPRFLNGFDFIIKTSSHPNRFEIQAETLDLEKKDIIINNIITKIEDQRQLLVKILLKYENDLRMQNFDIEVLKLYIIFLKENPFLMYNVDYQNVIIPFFDCLKNNVLPKEQLIKIEEFLKEYISTMREQYSIEINNKQISLKSETSKQKEIYILLKQHINNRCFVKQDFDDNINLSKKALQILEEYKNELTDKDIIDLLIHLKVCDYSHVYYIETDELKNKDFNIFYNAGDLKIDKIAFKYFQNISTEKISEEDFKLLLEKIKNKDFEIGTLNIYRELPSDTLIISAQDLHLNCAVSIKGVWYILGFFTSAIDNNTLKLSDLQEINDNPKEQNKLQMFRPGNCLIKIPDTDFIVDKKATDYAKDVGRDANYVKQQGNVSEKIIMGIEKQTNNLRDNPVGIPIVFTKDNLMDIGKEVISYNIKKYEEEKNQIYNSIKKAKTEKQQMITLAQKKNYLKEQEEISFRRSLSQFDRAIYDALQIMKENKKLEKRQKEQILLENNKSINLVLKMDDNEN